MFKDAARNKWLGRGVVLLIAIGIFLRVNRYLHGFPFWGDEAWVAQEVIRRSFQDILVGGNLLPSLGMPPVGFLFLERLCVLAVDFRELAFRFFPCLFGVAGIFLFRRLLKGLVSPRAGFIAFVFFIFSNLLIYYSSELKQYSSDVFFVLLVLIAHFRAVKSSMGDREVFRLAAAGVAALFFSLPSILVLCGIALVQLAVCFCQRAWRALLRYALVCSLWMAMFGHLWRTYYYLNYAGKEEVSYKQPYYLSCPLIQGDWGEWFHKLSSVFQSPVELSWPWLSALLFALGVGSLWKKDKPLLLALLAPLALTVGLSMANKYPFYERFLVFLVPILFILVAQGVDCVMNGRHWRRVLGMVILAVLLAQPVVNARNYVVPSSVTDLRSLVEYMREHQEMKDAVYFNNDSQWGYYIYGYFYYYLYADKVKTYNFQEHGILLEHDVGYEKPGQLFLLLSPDRGSASRVFGWDRVLNARGEWTRLPGGGRTWVLLSKVPPEKERAFIRCFDAFGRKLDERRSHNAVLYLYDLR